MGMIKIETWGSFGQAQKTISAQAFGHAQAVADAIAYLANEVLPAAIASDHRCHNAGISPDSGFARVPKAPKAVPPAPPD